MEISKENLEIMAYPVREGVLSPIGHDLALEAQKIIGKIEGDAIEITVFVGSLKVVGSMSKGQLDRSEPSEKDRKRIEEIMLKDVFAAKKFPEAVFHGKRSGAVVSGKLTLHGVTQEIRLELKDGKGSFVINQVDFNIKPYKALLGQLRVKPEVRVDVIVAGL